MAKYRISNHAKEDLIRIYQYGARKFGAAQAEAYFRAFFEYFDLIAERPLTFEAVDYIKPGYRRCICGLDSIFYLLNENELEIMAIAGRQDINLIF